MQNLNQPLAKRSLNFNINYNNKFLCYKFIIIGTQEFKDLDLDDILQIKIRKNHFCFATIIKKEVLSLDEIIIRGLHFFDMGVSEKEFKEFWSVNSSNKFVVLYLEKVTQLKLF